MDIDGPSGGLATLFAGRSALNAPINGGALMPELGIVVRPTLDGSGSAELSASVVAGLARACSQWL